MVRGRVSAVHPPPSSGSVPFRARGAIMRGAWPKNRPSPVRAPRKSMRTFTLGGRVSQTRFRFRPVPLLQSPEPTRRYCVNPWWSWQPGNLRKQFLRRCCHGARRQSKIGRMKSYCSIGALLQTWVCLVGSLVVPMSCGAATARQQAQARLLDHAELLCSNCLFGPSSYFYCFAVDNQILIGRQRVPVLNWEDNSKNYLTPVHGSWEAWMAPGQTVPITYDDKHIWVDRAGSKPSKAGFWGGLRGATAWITRADSKQVELLRSSPRDIFTNDQRCRGTH